MRKFATVLLSGVLLASCGGNQVRAKRPAAPAEPKEYTYSVRAVHPHPATSYTQGLQYADGRLWEGTGQHGESVVQTGSTSRRAARRSSHVFPRRTSAKGSPSWTARSTSSRGSRTKPMSTMPGRERNSRSSAIPARAGASRPTGRSSTCRTARQTSTHSTRPPSNAKSAPR